MRYGFLIFALFLAGCVSTPDYKVTRAFDPGEAAFIRQSGKSTISGQAFLRQQGGGVVYAAGEEVKLFPATPYSNEVFQQVFGPNKYKSAIDAYTGKEPRQFFEYTRTTKADGQGGFEFTNIAAGKYHIIVEVRWRVGDWQQGGVLLESVSVKPGETIKVIMSGT